jgi:SAM-dependent methyltransferase
MQVKFLNFMIKKFGEAPKMRNDYNIADKLLIKNLKTFDHLYPILEKQWIEIQNGLECSQLVILDPYLSVREIRKSIKALFLNSPYKWGIQFHIDEIENGIQIFSFSNQNNNYLNKLIKDYDSLLLNTSTNSYIKESIRSEINSIKKHEFSPPSFISSDNFVINKQLITEKKDRDLFESKIDVNSYNFFESVHPAYAYQMLRIYKFLEENQLQKTSFVDIGAGPGSALQMLLEVLPSYSTIDVIEPSPMAFAYLRSRFKDNCFVNTMQKGFFEYKPLSLGKLAISVGSSHHFNTYFLFQHARKILEDNAYLIISDEFISPYSNRLERKKNLISHHISYICDLMKLGDTISELPLTCSDGEVELVRSSHREYPKIKMDILSGFQETAESLCRNLLDKLTKLIGDNLNISNAFLSYYRLAYLELQALVAGLDYEVECKTYVENLIRMAYDEGFSLVHHEKIYSTSLGGAYHSGTHLVCFKKSVY